MNTDLVKSLTAVATKPAQSEGSSQKRSTQIPVPQETAAPPKEQQIVPSTQKVQETVAAVAAQIESYLRSTGRQVQFSIDNDSGRTVISVRDANTGDLIRQIPSEEALRLAQSLGVQQNALIDTVA